jgi:hypothetical protein
MGGLFNWIAQGASRLQPRRRPPLRCDGGSHRHSARDHHAGLVRRAGSAGIGARWARVQHGEVPQPLHAAHLRLYAMVNYYDSSIPGLGQSIKGFIDGGTIKSCEPHWATDGSTTMLNEIHAASSKTAPAMLNSLMNPYYAIVYFAVQFLISHLLAAISFRHPGLWSNRGNDHWIARADLHPVSCLRQARLAVLGMAQGVSRIQLLQGVAAAT